MSPTKVLYSNGNFNTQFKINQKLEVEEMIDLKILKPFLCLSSHENKLDMKLLE